VDEERWAAVPEKIINNRLCSIEVWNVESKKWLSKDAAVAYFIVRRESEADCFMTVEFSEYEQSLFP
jgi:hypothetical protein